MLSLVSRKDKDPNNSSSTNKNTTVLQLLKKDQRLQQSTVQSTRTLVRTTYKPLIFD